MLLTRKLAYGGLIAALVILVISVSYISPTADLALFTLSSLFIAILVTETDMKTGFMAYIASGILITAFYGIYFSAPFFVLFGLFPLIKGLIEQHSKRNISYIFKGAYFFAILAMAVMLFTDETNAVLANWNQIFSGNGFLKVETIWPLFVLALIILFIYDYALSILIGFFKKRIRGTGKSGK